MRKLLMYAAIAFIVLIFVPSQAAADSMVNTVKLTSLYPTFTTPLAPSEVIAVGSSLSCPNASIGLCLGTSSSIVYTIGTNSIDFTTNAIGTYSPASFNGYDFSGITFASGGSLIGFTLATNIAGLTAEDVSFGPSDISINLQGLSLTGPSSFFTLTPVPSPEPGVLTMLGGGLLGLAGLVRRRLAS